MRHLSKNHRKHEALMRRGLAQHEARKYAAALRLFEQALEMAPACPIALYNIANTLHMLGRDRRAKPILLKLVSANPKALNASCEGVGARSLQMDAYQLLSLVEFHGSGSREKALMFSKAHLRRRRRGLQSVWTLRQVREEIARMTSQGRQLPRPSERGR